MDSLVVRMYLPAVAAGMDIIKELFRDIRLCGC